MSADKKAFENITSALKSSTPKEKVNFYNSWAESYETDSAAVDYRGPSLAANMISSHFKGDREAAVVLDVACGTGLVAKQLKTHGFRQFVGNDGSETMLELARESGLYQELKQCLLGEEPLPLQWGLFDVVVIVGGLSWNHVPFHVVRDLCRSAKPGGYICMTCRNTQENAEYKAKLERELKKMEEEDLWTCVEVAEVKHYHKVTTEQEHDYIPASVYLYRKQ